MNQTKQSKDFEERFMAWFNSFDDLAYGEGIPYNSILDFVLKERQRVREETAREFLTKKEVFSIKEDKELEETLKTFNKIGCWYEGYSYAFNKLKGFYKTDIDNTKQSCYT